MLPEPGGELDVYCGKSVQKLQMEKRHLEFFPLGKLLNAAFAEVPQGKEASDACKRWYGSHDEYSEEP